MASSMLTAEVSASGSKEADVDKALKASLYSCVNNPDFAIVCDFLQKFSKDLGLDLPNFKFLLQWLTKTDEVSPQLRDMQIKLLRKTRKTVHEKSWESALSKFCFTYSAQDGWEIERFGYKNSSAKVKLRILRELLEYQFENNTKFRAKVLALSADSLRTKPMGRDRQGHCYWVTVDNDCNISIYQEHLDEEIWQVVATNRDEFVTLLKRLKGSEAVLPCKELSIVDEDTTSNSSQIDSDFTQKVPPPSEVRENEQKVPKLSIKFVQSSNLIETSNANDLSKGEEELAAEEDAKLLKKRDNCSDGSANEEFEELEECEDESSAETESDNTKNEKKMHSKKNGTDEKYKKNIKSKDHKKVEPLLISQNKVINNQNFSTYSNTGVKRSLDEDNLISSPVNENQLRESVPEKKIKATLIDPKCENNKQNCIEEYKQATNDDIEVEEEAEEEDIDSVAAEEDETEEKHFEDYDDDDDEEVGEEIFDPTMHVAGEGSGNDCDAENYLHNIDIDFDNGIFGLSDIIVENFYYFYGEGHGKECLVGNDNKDDTTNIVDKNKSELNIKEEENSEHKSENSMKNDNKKNTFLESTDCTNLNISNKNVLNEDSDKKVLAQVNVKEEVYQVNGGKNSEVDCKIETSVKKELHENEIYAKQLNEKTSETASEDDQSINMSSKQADSDVLIQQAKTNKDLQLESVQKELNESKQKLLETHVAEDSKINLKSPPICNRKRRLTYPQQATTARLSNSESEIEHKSENNEDYPNDKLENDEIGQDIGGKRLKMRTKQVNIELRKKIEAQKVAETEETTSSSGGEEELAKRKKVNLSKQSIISTPVLKSQMILRNLEDKKEISEHDGNLMDIDDKSKPTISQLVPLKQAPQVKSSKSKPTLAEIIEKKLKKTPEKTDNNLVEANNEQNMENESIVKKNYIPNKSPITKPLKKNLLIQIRQAESDEDTVPLKSTISQEINTDDIKQNETTNCHKSTALQKSYNKKQKVMDERQRKRRSSEETVKSDSTEELENKKEVALVKEKSILRQEAINQEITKENPKDFEDKEKPYVPVPGRRSARRSCAVPTYVDTLQSKRNRSSTKSSMKTEFSGKRNADKPSDIKTKPINMKNDVKEIEFKRNDKLLEIKNVDVSHSKSSLVVKTSSTGTRKQREVDTTNIIDIDSETPVRQSRRIAQQKIREEAERRKLEEIALRTMKQELKKKKKAEKQTDPTIVPPTEPSSESEESDVEIKKKIQKKKCPGKNGNWSSGSEEQEEPEEEDEEHPHYESDAGSPLFKSDHEFSPESDIEDESQVVPMKRARTVRKEDAEGEDTAKYDEEEACQKCNKSDHPEWILLCDNCDKGYHCSCLSPVLFYIPEGDWYCPPCQQEQLIKALENQLKEFDDLIENKKKIEEHEKRMAEEEKARKEREEEANKHLKRNDSKSKINSSGDHHSNEEGEAEAITYSECSIDNDSDNESSKKKYRNRSRNSKNIDKRKHRDRRRKLTRSRRNRLEKPERDSDSDSQQSSKSKSSSKSNSSSSSTYSESDNEPIYKLRKRRQINVSYRLNEYDDLINSALKKEMDEAAGAGNLGRGKDISTIIEADKEEKARQKQIDNEDMVANIKEEKIDKNVEVTKQESDYVESNERNTNEENETIKLEEIDSDAEPIIRKLNIKSSQKKKSRKLTTLDISSEDDDGSDEDFKGSSFDDDEEEEEDTSISASNSDSSLEIYKKHGQFKKKRRKAARRAFRERQRGRRYFVEESDDDDVLRPKSKKKRKDESDYTESEADDDDISELSENIDSADLCDDTTTDESDGAWRPNKRKKAKKSNILIAQKSPKSKISHVKKPKKIEYSDDDVSDSEDEDDGDHEEVGSGKGMGKQPRSQPLKSNSNSSKTKGKGKEKPVAKTKKKYSEDDSSQSDSEDSTRRTRGRRYAYIEDFDDDSSDGGIKPGVQRPDTPPEEREKFIKRQEEIKRMLAEKNAEGAKIVATPRLTPIKTDAEKDKRSPSKVGGDSLSTVPLSVIRQAKVLDIDYLQRRGENLVDLSAEVGEVGDDFDDADLPDDLPEDVDEDAIARMVEEEEFGDTAAKELPPHEEVLRTAVVAKSTKSKEAEKHFVPANTSQFPASSPQLPAVTLPTTTSLLQEPVRKKLPMPTMHPPLLRNQFLMHDSIPNHHLLQRHGGPHTSNLLQNALSAPLAQHLDRNYPPITPSATHHSLINRMTHSTPLQTTVPQALNTTRPSHPSISVNTKSANLGEQPAQQKSANLQTFPDNKPRGRRKKITPLRDTLQKQQTAAAVTAATASSSGSGKNVDPVSTSLLTNVIKSGTTPKLTMQPNITSNMPLSSHSAASRPAVHMPSIRGPYIRTDSPRFYDTLGSRISQTNTHRHRGPPQIPPSLLPPHPANRSSYGPPPPLKGSTTGTPVSSASNTSGSIRNPLHHIAPPYLGMPPNARHASHLNMYSRPPIYGNPNFGSRVNLRPNIHPPDYSSGSRAYPPYGFYPPPPPLTTPGQRPGPNSITRSSTQMPPTHPPASVIVSASPSKPSTTPNVTSRSPPSTTPQITDFSCSSNKAVAAQEMQIKTDPQKSSSQTIDKPESEKSIKVAESVTEPRKKLTTLQAYTATTEKKSTLMATDSPGSRSPHNQPTVINEESSTPGSLDNTPMTEQASTQEAHDSEFSGLVSYFSSQHDDYNT